MGETIREKARVFFENERAVIVSIGDGTDKPPSKITSYSSYANGGIVLDYSYIDSDMPGDEVVPYEHIEDIRFVGAEKPGKPTDDVAKQRWRFRDEYGIWWAGGQHYIMKAINGATDEQMRVAAAAPEVLELLEEYERIMEDYGILDYGPFVARVQAIIKKARGL